MSEMICILCEVTRGEGWMCKACAEEQSTEEAKAHRAAIYKRMEEGIPIAQQIREDKETRKDK